MLNFQHLTFYERKNEFYCIYSQIGSNNKYSVTFVRMPFYDEPIQIKLLSVIKFVPKDYEGERFEMIPKKSNISAKLSRCGMWGAKRHNDILKEYATLPSRLIFYNLLFPTTFGCFISSFFKCSKKYSADGVFPWILIRSSPIIPSAKFFFTLRETQAAVPIPRS